MQCGNTFGYESLWFDASSTEGQQQYQDSSLEERYSISEERHSISEDRYSEDSMVPSQPADSPQSAQG